MKRLACICAALSGVLLVAASSGAAFAAPPEFEAEISADEQLLDGYRRLVDSGRVDDVSEVEDDLRALRKRSRDRLDLNLDELRALERDRDLLGPAPAVDAPPEDSALAERRNEIRAALAKVQGQRTRLQANLDEAAAIIASLSQRRLALLYQSLWERGEPLFSGRLWRDAIAGAGEAFSGLARHIDGWAEEQREKGPSGLLLAVGLLAAVAAISVLIIGPAHRVVRRRFLARAEEFKPTPGRRAALAGAKMIARLLPGVLGGALVIGAARATEFLPPERMNFAVSLWAALVGVLIIEGLASGLFSRTASGWRIAVVDAERGRAASRLILAIVIVFGLRVIFVGAADIIDAPRLGALVEGVAAFLIGALLVLLCRPGLWRRQEASTGGERPSAALNWSLVRSAGRWLGVAIVLASLIGYVALADFAASRLYYLVLALALAWALRAGLNELAAWAGRRLASDGSAVPSDGEKSIFLFWTGLAIDALLLCAIAPALLLVSGISASRLSDIAAQAFFGFRIGGVTISLAQIAVAIGLFIAGLAATRVLQRGLARGPFAHSRLDIGVQNSLTTLIGYVGLALASLIGVTALGVNLSNLAIIAGALSVGVGFGLQSVVNNFVSGLILLFERPIKVGDWIVTASGEGTVRKISVRSTEIETFDRSTIIVPNSELIAQTVTNWTHRDKLGRITIPVGVAYGADPEAVRDLLLKCANDHPDVLRYPEAFVVWADFGASSLDFELRAFIADISRGLQTRTDLRFAIYKAFRAAGVEIPFPQQDVYIKTLPDAAPRARPVKEAEGPASAAPPHEPENAGEMAQDD